MAAWLMGIAGEPTVGSLQKDRTPASYPAVMLALCSRRFARPTRQAAEASFASVLARLKVLRWELRTRDKIAARRIIPSHSFYRLPLLNVPGSWFLVFGFLSPIRAIILLRSKRQRPGYRADRVS